MCKQTEKAFHYLDISDWLETNESEQSQVFNSIVSGAFKPVFPHHWLLNHPSQSMAHYKRLPGLFGPRRASWKREDCLCHSACGHSESTLQESPVLYHFCSYSHSSSTGYIEIVKSLILQICRLYPALVQYFAIDRTGSSLAEDALENHLGEMIASRSFNAGTPIYVILDGIDECDCGT